jgi:flagellar operon protein
MTDRISIGQLYPSPIPPGRKPVQGSPSANTNNGRSFQEILQDNVLRFSHHAEIRLQQRGIQLKPEQIAKLDSAVTHLAQKGANDSLIVMNDMALIVNVKSKTVITAMDGASMRNNVFTQIDSAVVIS